MFNTDQIDMVSRGISSNSRCDTIRGIGGITGTVITGGSGPLIDKSLEHSQSLVHNQLGAGVSCILSVVPLQCVHYCTLLIALSGVLVRRSAPQHCRDCAMLCAYSTCIWRFMFTTRC
jgi:hypothetical protein